LAVSAQAQNGVGDGLGGDGAPAYRYAAPLAADTPAKPAKSEPAPEERQAPPTAPDGCPFRGGKLDLIA
jgi:hypothetical protein